MSYIAGQQCIWAVGIFSKIISLTEHIFPHKSRRSEAQHRLVGNHLAGIFPDKNSAESGVLFEEKQSGDQYDEYDA